MCIRDRLIYLWSLHELRSKSADMVGLTRNTVGNVFAMLRYLCKRDLQSRPIIPFGGRVSVVKCDESQFKHKSKVMRQQNLMFFFLNCTRLSRKASFGEVYSSSASRSPRKRSAVSVLRSWRDKRFLAETDRGTGFRFWPREKEIFRAAFDPPRSLLLNRAETHTIFPRGSAPKKAFRRNNPATLLRCFFCVLKKMKRKCEGWESLVEDPERT